MADEQNTPVIESPRREPVSERSAAKATKLEPVLVNVLTIDDGKALVEWHDDKGVQRALVRSSQIDPDRYSTYGTVNATSLHNAERYGVDWNEALSEVEGADEVDDLAVMLHGMNVWTAEELLNNLMGESGGQLVSRGLSIAGLRRAAEALIIAESNREEK